MVTAPIYITLTDSETKMNVTVLASCIHGMQRPDGLFTTIIRYFVDAVAPTQQGMIVPWVEWHVKETPAEITRRIHDAYAEFVKKMNRDTDPDAFLHPANEDDSPLDDDSELDDDSPTDSELDDIEDEDDDDPKTLILR